MDWKVWITWTFIFCIGIQDYFQYTVKRNEAFTYNPPVILYVNKIENRINFKIKTEHYLELLAPDTMKFLGSTITKITKDKNGENVPHLKISSISSSFSKLVVVLK